MSSKDVVIVRHSTEVSHYLKIVGVLGSLPVTSVDVRQAFQTLQESPIETRQRGLTFAMKLSEDHHCTICYVNQDFSEKMIACIENYLKEWQKCQFDIVAKGKALFGQKKVILLEFTSRDYNMLFQHTSQHGTKEGKSVVRTPHLTYYGDETVEGGEFISKILHQLK
jgi:hypothetical protein